MTLTHEAAIFSFYLHYAVVFILYILRCIYNSNQTRVYRLKLIFLFITTLSNLCLFIGCDYNSWLWAWLSLNIFPLFLLIGDQKVTISFPVKIKYKQLFITLLFVSVFSGVGTCQFFSKLTNACGVATGVALKHFMQDCSMVVLRIHWEPGLISGS